MAALKMSVKHGQPFAVASANFDSGISRAEAKFRSQIRQVEWSDDRSSATLKGPGFEVLLKVDADSVHATGHVPFFFKLFEGQMRKFVEETLAFPGNG